MAMKIFLYIIMGAGLAATVFSADAVNSPALYSPTTGQLFSRLGNDLLGGRLEEVDVAMTFLQAGILLDEQSAGGYEQFLRGAGKACGSRQDYSDTILLSLRSYLDRKSDLEIVAKALGCVVDSANSRQEREAILGRLLNQLAEANPVFGSDVATQLGLYAVEKADYTEAVKRFESACQLNPYNLLAGAKLLELRSQQIPTAAKNEKLTYLRLRLTANPTDLQAVIEFGQITYQMGLYVLAADAFEYAASLYAWLRPNVPLSDEIAVGWAESCYFVPSRQPQCMAIADQLRKAGKFNLAVESVAVLSAQKLAKENSKEQAFDEVASEAEQLLISGSRDVTPAQIGWFYCFVRENPEKSLAWCNKAFAQSPEDPAVKSLLAYAFLLNRQNDMAGQYVQTAAENDSVAMLVRAGLEIQNDQKQKAAELLRKVLDSPIPPVVRNKADDLFKQCGVEEIVPDASGELVRKNLTDKFGKNIIPAFVSPDKLFSARLNFNGTEFAYSYTIEAEIVIANTGSMPLIIGREGLLAGRYQVDVQVQGDLNVKIPCLLEGSFRPARPILPGESISVRLDVDTGKLEKILFTYPQASLEMKFSIYLDPTQTDDGMVASGIRGIDPIEATIRRKGVVLTKEFLVQRLETLAKGQEGLKIRTAELFIGLYAEQVAYQAGVAMYRHTQTESTLLTDAVRRAILDENWKVRAHTLILLSQHSIGLNYAMTLSVSENLNDENWPVRMAAMWLLANQQKTSFQSVLDWSCQNDPFWLNRKLAVALGGNEKKEPVQTEPAPNEFEPQKQKP
jgi:tetratricopeptide (TPR) repeat protein